MTDTHGGHYAPPSISCSDCGRTGGRFSKVKGEWLCDECVEMEEMTSGFTFPKMEKQQAFNPPRFVWGRPEGKEVLS